jgi:hypothetical protein
VLAQQRLGVLDEQRQNGEEAGGHERGDERVASGGSTALYGTGVSVAMRAGRIQRLNTVESAM